MPRPKPVVLIIIDGWGIAPKNQGNAIELANTPTMDDFKHSYPYTTIAAAGESVGLPKGEDGNTETGHLNIGAGSVVYQDLPRINQSIANGSFAKNPEILAAIEHSKKNNSKLHLLGLIGSGGVHSNIEHLHALITVCKEQQAPQVALHLITDGRDSPPTSAINFIYELKRQIKDSPTIHIASIMGRYYAMDRDHRWERTAIAYKAMTQGIGDVAASPEEAILASYAAGITDEFIKPLLFLHPNNEKIVVSDNDAVIFFNFRIDRPRQLTKAFVFPNFEYVSVKKDGFDPYAIKYYRSHLVDTPAGDKSSFDRGPLLKNLYFVTMTEYETGLPAHVAFPPQLIEMPLGRLIAEMGLRQLRMSETEKERFVTYYFNGQREDQFPGEDRIIIPSPPVATYDQKPEMSSRELTQTLLERLNTNLYDFIALNFANPDMVGHTGNLQAGINACEITDQNIKTITDAVLGMGGVCVITGDHGNVEEMINLETGGIDTEHSTNPVPFYIIGEQFKNQNITLHQGMLADVAPTIIKLMDLPKPNSMSGNSLL